MGKPEAVFRKRVIFQLGLRAYNLAGRLSGIAFKCAKTDDGELKVAFDPYDVPSQPGDPLLVNMPEDFFIDISSVLADLLVDIRTFADEIKALMNEFW